MNDNRNLVLTWAFALIPYALVAWGYKKLTGGDDGDYWIAFGVLIAVRLFFSLIETLGGILAWRVYGKGLAVQRLQEFLRKNEFPQRIYKHDDVGNYLARISNDPKYPVALKVSAATLETILAIHEQLGMLVGARQHAAAEATLERHSPRALAPAMT